MGRFRPGIRPAAAALLLAVFLIASGCGGGGTGGSAEGREQAQILLSNARQQFDARNYDRALELVDQAARAAPEFGEIYFARGEIYRHMGRIGPARKAYRRATELGGGENRPVRLRLGDLAREENRYGEALEWYERELAVLRDRAAASGERLDALSPRSPSGRLLQQIQVRRARTHALRSELEPAEDLLREVLARDSTHARAHYYWAKIEQERGHDDRALHRARRAVRHAPYHPVYRYLVGSLLVQAERPREAISHLERVVEVQPQHVGAHYNLGRAYVQLGQEERAEAYFADSDSLRVHQQRINEARARAYQQREDPDRWLAFAEALRGSGQNEQALGAYRATLARDSTSVEAWLGFGTVLRETGDTAGARRAFDRVLRRNPSHERARRMLRDLTRPDQ